MDDQEWSFPPRLTRPWRSVKANAYVSYHAVRRVLERDPVIWPTDALCTVLMRMLWAARGREAQAALGHQLGLPRSTLSSALGRLEREGLIERYRAFDDRRANVVTLTSGGELRAEQVGIATQEIERSASMTVGDNGRKGFNAMANVLGTIIAEPDPWADY